MNKFTTVALSVLGTVGTSVGAVAVINNLPATKDKLNISYGETKIVGNGNSNNVDYESLISKLEAENKEKENKILQLNTSIETINSQIEDLQSDIEEKDEEIIQLETDNSTKFEEIETLKASIEANNQRIAELEQSTEDKSSEIAELQADNQSKDTQISSLNATIENNNATISELESTKEANETTIANLNSDIATKETQITSLQTQLETNNTTIAELQSKVDNYETILSNYAIVTYIIEGSETTVLQDKGSLANYHENFPIGFIAGWSLNESGTNIVSEDYVVQDGDVLYAVLESSAQCVNIHLELEGNKIFGVCSVQDFGFGSQVVCTIDNKEYLISNAGYRSIFITGVKYTTIDDGVEHEITFDEIYNMGEGPMALAGGDSMSMPIDDRLIYLNVESANGNWKFGVSIKDDSGSYSSTNVSVNSFDFMLLTSSESNREFVLANYQSNE